MTSMTLEQWVDRQQARGKYTFLRSDAVEQSGLSAEAVKKALQRLVKRGRLVKVKDYFFVIVPLEYAAAGAPPPSWYVHDLAVAMRVSYYVGLLSAAAQYGAAHQSPQEFQVIADRYVRPLVVGRGRIRFLTSKYVELASVIDHKTPTGAMRVSTPETTAFDLVRFRHAAGGLDQVAGVIAELASQLDAQRLLAAVKRVHDVPNAQRLGYLLDRLGAKALSKPLHEWLDRQSPRRIPLRSGRPVDRATEDHRWHVLLDAPLEVET